MDNHKILYVDDDKENLRTFRRLFRKYYHILLAESGEEGLQILREHAPIPLIITDQRMPEMTGIEFLNHSIRISPESIRIIITGFTDVQALIDAINTGRVYRYITKPWDEQELYVTMKRAVESYELKMQHSQLLIDLRKKNEALEHSYTMLQETQEKLIQSEKLASIGHLASRIAHELRNPIQGIRMGIELLKQDLSELPESLRFQESSSGTLHHIDQEILAVNTIVQDLLEYAREMKFEYTETDVNSLLEGVLFTLTEKITERQVTVHTTYGDVGTITADGIRIRQVILNVVQNGLESMENGGELTITTASETENRLSISIQDIGCGMTPDQQKRIFEPFFTTKNKGVGLGMAIVGRIIEAHDGTIQLESEEGKGTTFTLFLPRQPGNFSNLA